MPLYIWPIKLDFQKSFICHFIISKSQKANAEVTSHDLQAQHIS